MSTQVPQRTDDLVDRATGLFDLLRSNVERANADRRLPEENIEAIRDAGLFRVWNPKRYGGHEADFGTQMEMCAELSRACSSSGWVTSLLTVCNWLACMLPERAQDEIFGEDPDARVCGVLIPGPYALTPVDGGYEFTGEWPWASGCHHATWAMLPAAVTDEQGQMVNAMLLFVPMSDLTIKDTWHVLGMRGTGSNTLVGDKLFIPEHRTYPLLGPQGALEGSIRSEHTDESLYWAPLGMAAGTCITGACLGMARAARDHCLEKLPRRGIAYSFYTESTKAVSTQMAMAEACTQVDMATMLGHRVAADCDAAGLNGGPPDSLVLRTRARNDAAYAAQTCREAVDRFVRVLGGSGAADADLIQQIHRDINTASLHGALQTASTLELYGAALCGEVPSNSFLF